VRLRENRGQAAALNVGAEQARGRYLAILDADDEATADRLEHQLVALAGDRELVLVGGAVEPWCDLHARAGPVWRYASDDASIRARSLFKSEFISGAMTFDRELFVRHGLRFDEGLRVGADWASSIQAMRIGRVANLDRVVMRYRVHPGQLTTGMMDDLGSDSTRIRVELLTWLGVRPSERELRVHLAVSPCNYWPFGAHPYFRQHGASIVDEADRWFDRLEGAAGRSGRVPPEALRAYLEEIASRIAARVAEPAEAPGREAAFCPVAHPRACVEEPPRHPSCRRPA
jgi:glycosyltransferase involved in cell wall biosynthesis